MVVSPAQHISDCFLVRVSIARNVHFLQWYRTGRPVKQQSGVAEFHCTPLVIIQNWNRSAN